MANPLKGKGMSIEAKATQLLAERRVQVMWCFDETLSARVRGDSGVHDIRWSRLLGWECTCPCRQRCSHMTAVSAVTMRSVGRTPCPTRTGNVPPRLGEKPEIANQEECQ